MGKSHEYSDIIKQKIRKIIGEYSTTFNVGAEIEYILIDETTIEMSLKVFGKTMTEYELPETLDWLQRRLKPICDYGILHFNVCVNIDPIILGYISTRITIE